MFDPDAPSSRRALEAMAMPDAQARIVAGARKITGSDSDAEDLVNDAFSRVLDPDDAPWVPDRSLFAHHMTNLIRQMWSAEMQTARVRHEVLDGALTTDDPIPSSHPSADDELDRRRTLARRQRLMADVLAEIGSREPMARQIYDLTGRGEDEPAEQARILGCDIADVYRATATMKRHAKRASDAWELAEAQRMRELPSAAMAKREATS